MSEGVFTICIAVVMVVGLVGTLLPMLPGLVLMWVSALVYGFVIGFGPVGVAVMILLTLLLVASFVASVVLPRRAAQEGGASTVSQLVGLVCGVIGFFVIPVVGLIVGVVVGIFVAEWVREREGPAAWASTKAVLIGFAKSAALDFGIGMVMLLAWAGWVATA